MPCAYAIRDMFNSIILRVSVDEPELKNPDIWKEIRETFSNSYLVNSLKGELFNIILRLAPQFVEKDCQDKVLITHVLNLARTARVQHYPWHISCFIHQRFYGISRSYLKEIIRSRESDVFMTIFSVPYKEAQVFFTTEDAVTYSAVAGDIALLQLLLKFGATMIPPPGEYSLWMYCESVVQLLFSNIPVRYIQSSLSSNFSQASERRLFFVVLCLEVLIHWKSPTWDSCNYITSLRLFFKAIPEPLVTSEEIFSFLDKLLRGLQKDEEIQTVVNEFGNFFPESLQTPGPRSLKHLGRFQVRENLRAAFPFRLPQAIGSLPLPTELKNYILLDIV